MEFAKATNGPGILTSQMISFGKARALRAHSVCCIPGLRASETADCFEAYRPSLHWTSQPGRLRAAVF